ncbi:MAG: hypothetical protein H6624_04690 [Bdellovibrionaceae bacterium]|nr:hypothetical protein [Bdellovibrionales bacterium]MCB9083615.1 hypothetical protein [Pseudobdellovibrionaceae bacterium]
MGAVLGRLPSRLAMVLFLAFAGLFTAPAWAILDLYVQDDLPVYEEPEKGARQVSRLTRGDRVVISSKIYGAYRKVLVTYGGKRRGGYVRISQLRRSYIKSREDVELEGKRIYSQDYALGLSLIGSYMRQGARSFSTSSADQYDISAFASTTFFFSLFADIPWSKTMMLRPYLTFRSTKFKGEAELVGSINALRPAQVTLEQSFLGLGLMAKFYGVSTDSFWYGGGIELGNGTKSELVIDDGIPLKVDGDDKPFFALLYGAIGWDIPAPGAMWLVPDIRLGVVPNNDPMIMYFEVYLSGAYSFR